MRDRLLLSCLAFAAFVSCVGTCAPNCPSDGCPEGELCHGTVDDGSYCCAAAGAACTGGASSCCAACTDAGTCGCLPSFERAECRSNADCCSGRCAVQFGFDRCVGQAPGGACTVNDDCITGECDAGACRCHSGGSGGDCLVNADCCFGGCVRSQNEELGHCCYPTGVTCFLNADCCSGQCSAPDGGSGTCG